jgi:phenylacetate-CoA ligase
VVRGTNIYPRAIEEIVHGRAEIEEFQVRLYTEEGIRDEVEVLVECAGDDAQVESILADLRTELARAHEGLRIGVRRVEAESLPRFELKAKRLVDEREVWGGKGERKAV